MDFAGTLHPALCRCSNKILKVAFNLILEKKETKETHIFEINHQSMF